jgi:hypothetical protein
MIGRPGVSCGLKTLGAYKSFGTKAKRAVLPGRWILLTSAEKPGLG